MMNQRAALLVLTAALALLAIWVLRHFLPALAWAAVLAIATWPLYARLLHWLPRLPAGGCGGGWWRPTLADPAAAKELIGRVNRSVLFEWTRSIGIQLLARSTILIFTLLALFFLYRDGGSFARQLAALARRVFGPAGAQGGQNVLAPIPGTVDGPVPVDVGDGL